MLGTMLKEVASGQYLYEHCILCSSFKMHSTRFAEPMITQDWYYNNNNKQFDTFL